MDEHLHPVQLQILRQMTMPEKLQLADEMSRAVLEARFANLRSEHPGWSESRLMRRFAEILYGSEVAARAYPDP